MNIVVLVTASSKEEAETISRKILEEKLAACVNIIEGINSYFWWEGKIDTSGEVILIIKTNRRKFKRLASTVKSLHSYDTPEIIALPIIAGDKRYLEWINDSLR